jgi:uncharacterized protein (TIGR03118 family)
MSRFQSNIALAALAAALSVSGARAAPVVMSDAQLNVVVGGTRFAIVNQVADQTGIAPVTDAQLVNPWGLSSSPTSPLWVADNGADRSTVYDRNTFAKNNNLNVAVPGGPTGTTFIGIANSFMVSAGGKTGQTQFAFATESGQIDGWNSTVNASQAVVAVDESAAGSVFKGLTLGMTSSGAPRLFAADFAHGMVSVYDSSYAKVGSFTDPNLPADYAPFNVQTLNGKLYVTFANRAPGALDETAGQGKGFVDVFDTDGHLLQRLVNHGQLNAPWGLAIAPASFGQFAGALLVGNFGDGRINAYDPNTGEYLGAVRAGDNKKLSIDGLWALRTGPNGTITFSAGPADESHGLLGSLGVTTTWGHDQMVTQAELHGR